MREKALKLQRPKTVQILRAKTVNPLIRVFSANLLKYKIKCVIIYLTSAPGFRWVFMCSWHMNIRICWTGIQHICRRSFMSCRFRRYLIKKQKLNG